MKKYVCKICKKEFVEFDFDWVYPDSAECDKCFYGDKGRAGK